jgi:hypothetical protein
MDASSDSNCTWESYSAHLRDNQLQNLHLLNFAFTSRCYFSPSPPFVHDFIRLKTRIYAGFGVCSSVVTSKLTVKINPKKNIMVKYLVCTY